MSVKDRFSATTVLSDTSPLGDPQGCILNVSFYLMYPYHMELLDFSVMNGTSS